MEKMWKKFLMPIIFGITFTAFAQTAIVPPAINRSLFLGISGNDIKELQQYLAQDKQVYPEGLATGYFGKLTEAAVQRFQCKQEIVCAGNPATTGYGRVGPKTITKLNELRTLQQPPTSSSTPEQPTPATPVLEPEPVATATPAEPTPIPSIKNGTGTVAVNRYITLGTGTFLYAGGIARENRGYLFPGDPVATIANVTRSRSSSCESIEAKGYIGINNICEFTEPSKYTFTEHVGAIRFYDKDAVTVVNTSLESKIVSCYQKILIFKQNNLYGAIEPVNIDYDGTFTFNYWYDESGGANFGTLCPARSKNINNTASLLDALKMFLEKLNELLTKKIGGSL
jgi:peptidoglycan hydrolase-like protein with peptidoglycan-binding domain